MHYNQLEALIAVLILSLIYYLMTTLSKLKEVVNVVKYLDKKHEVYVSSHNTKRIMVDGQIVWEHEDVK